MPPENIIKKRFNLKLKYYILSIPITSKQELHVVTKKSLCSEKDYFEDEWSNVYTCSV